MPEIVKSPPASSIVTVRQDLNEVIDVGQAGQDVSVSAAAAAAKAEIEARIIAARKWRRDVDMFREGLLKDCRRPTFAEIALYEKPVGRKRNAATGQFEENFAVNFSIRFIENALQHWGNVHTTARITGEDAERVLLTVQVIDVERNVGYATDATIDKLVERKELKGGRRARGMRQNSYGETVYLVEATKDEIRNLIGAERSKLLRDNGQRLLPRDILDEARAQIDRVTADENAKDPDSAKKKVLDRFATLGISAAMLKKYLERPIETLTAEDLKGLASLFNGLKEGEFTWAEVLRKRAEAAEKSGEAGDAPAAPQRLRDKILKESDKKETK